MGITFQVLDEINKTGSVRSIKDLAQSLQLDRSALEGIIDYWVRKGKILRIENSVCAAGSCGQCSLNCPARGALPHGVVLYQPSSVKSDPQVE